MASLSAKTAAHKAAVREGAERLLDAAGIAVDRLPMLNVIFDRMVTLCAESFRYLTSTPPMFTIKAIRSERFGEILDSRADRVALAVFQATAWDSRILVGVDHDLVFTFTEALFGGDGSEPAQTERRRTLEHRAAGRADDLRACRQGHADGVFLRRRDELSVSSGSRRKWNSPASRRARTSHCSARSKCAWADRAGEVLRDHPANGAECDPPEPRT